MIDNEHRDYCFDKMVEIQQALQAEDRNPSPITTWGYDNVAAGLSFDIHSQIFRPIRNSKIYFPLAISALVTQVNLQEPYKHIYHERKSYPSSQPEIIASCDSMIQEMNLLIAAIMGSKFKRKGRNARDCISSISYGSEHCQFDQFSISMELPFPESRHIWSAEALRVERDWYQNNPRARLLAQIPKEFQQQTSPETAI